MNCKMQIIINYEVVVQTSTCWKLETIEIGALVSLINICKLKLFSF